jgi:hypothetical protein
MAYHTQIHKSIDVFRRYLQINLLDFNLTASMSFISVPW